MRPLRSLRRRIALRRRIRIGWWNVGDGPWAPKAAFLRRMIDRHQLDVIGLSETGDRIPDLLGLAADLGWKLRYSTDPGGKSVVLLVAPHRVVKAASWTLAHGTEWVGNPGAGPARVKAKGVQRVRVSGGWNVLASHLVVSSMRDLANQARRQKLYRLEVGAINEILHRVVTPAACVGDFNGTEGYRLLDPLRWTEQVVDEPTFGHETIDLGWLKGCRAEQVIVENAPERDHNMVVLYLRRGLRPARTTGGR